MDKYKKWDGEILEKQDAQYLWFVCYYSGGMRLWSKDPKPADYT